MIRHSNLTWWRYQIKAFCALLALCEGNPPVTGGFPSDSHHKGQSLGALMLSLICAWTDGWAKNLDAGDLRRHQCNVSFCFTITVLLVIKRFYSKISATNCYSRRSDFSNYRVRSRLEPYWIRLDVWGFWYLLLFLAFRKYEFFHPCQGSGTWYQWSFWGILTPN